MKKVLAINNQFPTEENKKYGLTSAVSYYRQVMPGRHLEGYEFHHLGHQLIDLDVHTAETRIGNMVHAHDIVFTKHLDNPTGIYMLLGACDYYDRPLIVDFDDDVFATDGKEHNLYVYPEDSDARRYLEVLLREATAITVSVPSLVPVYQKYNDHVYVCPNAVDPKDWNGQRTHHKRLTIGWPASTGHIVDHEVLEPVATEIAKCHPDIVFSFMGHYLPEHMGFLHRKNWELKPGVLWWEGHPTDKRTYPSVLADFGADIGVGPLIDSRYNASRSLAKWFEYTMTGTPMVASDYGPYKDLSNGEDVYLAGPVDKWIEYLSLLIEKPDERRRIADNAKRRIEREYTIQRAIPAWRAAFEAVRGFRKFAPTDFRGKG